MSDRFKGLTRGDERALSALGVERLEEDEVSKPVRIRVKQRVFDRLKEMSAKDIGDLLERALSR